MERLRKTVYGLTLGLVASVFINTIAIMLTSVWLFAMIVPVVVPTLLICTVTTTSALKSKLKAPGYLVILMVFLLGVPPAPRP